MFKSLRKQEGFTLIELMIVVAIIGILAAIAIPNFLTYQMKSRQSEAKTNLQAIRTSEVSFQAENGCYIGILAEGVAAPAGLTKTVPFPWGAGAVPTVPAAPWCTGGAANFGGGTFRNIGFVATGNVNYRYIVDSTALAVPVTPAASCASVLAALPTGAGVTPQTSFVAVATSNLDGDNNNPNGGVSLWDSSNDHGATDCTVGQF